MQTRPRRIVPLRPPAATTAPDCARAHSETRARLQATFASFYNALFDAACLANDEQRHARTIQLLRAVKAQENVIIEGICADIARPGAPAEAPGAQLLERALAQHCGALALEPGEQALLAAACTDQLLAPDRRARTAPAGDHDSAARLVARLRAVGLELEPAITPDGADGASPGSAEPAPESAPIAVTQEPRRRVTRRVVMAALAAVALAALSALFLEPISRAIRPPAPVAARILPAPVAHAAPVVASATQQAATPPLPADEPAFAPATAAPLTEPAPAPPAPADALPAPETPAVDAQIEAVTAPARDVAPAAAARLATQVSYLLQRGDVALEALRLSEPFADSAAANYTAVLAIDAQNAEARWGLQRIVTAYTGLARNALQRGDKKYAQQLLARARTVMPGSAALQQLEQEIGNAPAADP